MDMIILGIDPGLSGGISKLKQDGARWIPSAIAMPDSERAVSDHLWSIYAEAQTEKIEVLAFIERVHAMPATREYRDANQVRNYAMKIAGHYDAQLIKKLTELGLDKVTVTMQGATGTFTFGRGYGFLRGCLVTIGIPFEEVAPQTWQKHLDCKTGGNKNVSKGRAQQLFPHLKITHKIADALLIAEYGRRIRLGLSAGALFEQQRPIVSHTSAISP